MNAKEEKDAATREKMFASALQENGDKMSPEIKSEFIVGLLAAKASKKHHDPRSAEEKLYAGVIGEHGSEMPPEIKSDYLLKMLEAKARREEDARKSGGDKNFQRG